MAKLTMTTNNGGQKKKYLRKWLFGKGGEVSAHFSAIKRCKIAIARKKPTIVKS